MIHCIFLVSDTKFKILSIKTAFHGERHFVIDAVCQMQERTPHNLANIYLSHHTMNTIILYQVCCL